MPKYHGGSGRNKDRDTTPARQLRKAAGPGGVFRCDRCDRVVPEALLVTQDGHGFCRTLCADATSFSEHDVMLAEQMAQTDGWAANANPPTNAFDGAVTITSHTAFPVTLSGSTPSTVVFTGVGFTSSIVIAYDDADIVDDTAPVITATSITLSVKNGLAVSTGPPLNQTVTTFATPGLHNITIAGSVCRGALFVPTQLATTIT